MLQFDNRFVRELPGDPEAGNFTRQVHGAAWSRVSPTPVARPTLLAWSRELVAELGLGEAVGDPAFGEVFGGNRAWPGMDPWAMNYGGHQFGNWAGQLGDGRAISLGEAVVGGRRYELQLKGAGPTPYSRRADGRAVLRSSLREFLCSEAMFHLGVPTTRALSLVGTGEEVERDMFYDGHPALEPGAVVCRVAPSFVRFGTFELPASRRDVALLRKLVDFTIARDFPDLGAGDYAGWFREVCERTARLLGHWMRVGFVHGVMNTDNMSILGLTIDYGPYGFLEPTELDWTPNTTDAQGRRYAFGRQPEVAMWNLQALASALLPLFADRAPLEDGLRRYAEVYVEEHRRTCAARLGLASWSPDDGALVKAWTTLLVRLGLDHTLAWRALSGVDPERPDPAVLAPAVYDEALFEQERASVIDWLGQYAARLRQEGGDREARRARMDAINPWIVPRNYLAVQAIDAATEGDLSELAELLEALRRPYEEQPRFARFAARRPAWAKERAGSSMLSCSS